MAETATKERPNKVKITDIGPCLKKLHIEVPAETVAEQLGSSIDTLMVDAELPGFRKGRAPRRLIERKFGDTLRREAKNQLVVNAYTKAIEESKLRVVGDPTASELDKIELTDGKPLAFDLEVEVSPEFDLPSIEGVEVKKPRIETTEEMIDKDIERLCLNEGGLKPKEKVEHGDYLTGHAVMKGEDAKVILDIQDAVIQVPPKDKNGKGMILGVVVDDFGDQIGLPKVGETVTVKTTGPENHENEAVRGKKLTISFHAKRADQIVPATPDEVAGRYGLEGIAQVREAVKARIDERVKVEQQAAMRNQVAKYLLESTKMDLPERINAAQAARNLERARMELMYRGMDPQKIEENLAEIRSNTAKTAAAELKLYFILDKIAEKLEVKVTEGEMNQRIAQIAFSRGERPERVRQEIVARNQLAMVYEQIREHKVMDGILAKAKVEEVDPDELNKPGAEDKTSKPKSSAKKDDDAPKSHAKKAEHKDEDAPKSHKKAADKDDDAPKKSAKSNKK